MSDYIVKIVPQDPFCKISEPILQKAGEFLEANIPCDSIEMKGSMTPVFVDCGGSLESIACPECHSELSFGWWGEAMEKANERGFTSLETKLPCCGKIVSLNDLEYHFPCGFACCVINILNPVQDPENWMIDSIQEILGTNVCIIKAHI